MLAHPAKLQVDCMWLEFEWFRFHALHLNTEQEGEEQWGIVLTMNGGRGGRRWIFRRSSEGGSDASGFTKRLL